MYALNVSYLLLVWLLSHGSTSDVVVKIISTESAKDTPQEWKHILELVLWSVFEVDSYASQIFRLKNPNEAVLCDEIGNIDRAKHPSDFVLVVKNQNSPVIDCDPEWGRQNFAILNINSATIPTEAKIVAEFYGGSSEINSTAIAMSNVNQVMKYIKQNRVDYSESRIPDDYADAAKKTEDKLKRTYLAIIALLVLSACALLGIMFANSLARHNQKKQMMRDMEKKKKQTDEIVSRVEKKTAEAAKAKAESEKQAKSKKSKKEEKSEKKDAKNDDKKPDDKSDKSEKTEKTEKKEDASKKTEKEEDSKKEEKKEENKEEKKKE